MSLEISLKEEPLWQNEHGVSKAAARAGLYANHIVKDELVLGPEVLQTPYSHDYIKEQQDYVEEEKYVKRELKSPSRVPDLEIINSQLQVSAADKETRPNNSPVVTAKLHKPTETPRKNKAKYHCEICNTEFTKWSSLDRHNRRHTSTFYDCKLCKKQFTRQDHLEHHMYTHMGLKPYACRSCAAKFTQMSNLKRHERLHDSVKNRKLVQSGAKGHVCEICSKRFGRLTDLKRHTKIHFR